MSTEIKVPTLPESVTEASIAKWHKDVGDQIARDEPLVDLETDKVVMEVPSPVSGIVKEIRSQVGANVKAHEVIAVVDEKAATESSIVASPTPAKVGGGTVPAAKPAQEPASGNEADKRRTIQPPATRKVLNEENLTAEEVLSSIGHGSGKGGRLTPNDIKAYKVRLEQREKSVGSGEGVPLSQSGRVEQRVPMTRIRARIAERLLQAQTNTAMLTTFNEVDLSEVLEMRARHKAAFESVNGVKLGLMSFFVKASVEALRQYPTVNASVDGTDVIYHGYYDIGVAVATERGLVVPILRDVNAMSFADIEKQVGTLSERARNNKLTMEDLTGGTFSITNGGIFGSMLSTPILNPPQAAILGMHAIKERPVVENGEIAARPMMYLALTYDHRLIDGREAVLFLRTIKECIEDPSRLLLEI